MNDKMVVWNGKKIVLGLGLLLSGIIGICLDSMMEVKPPSWESNLVLDTQNKSPIIQLHPGAESRLGVFLRVEAPMDNPEGIPRAFNFPLSYTILNRAGKVLVTEEAAISNQTGGESILTSTRRSYILYWEGISLYKSFFAPSDGQVRITYRLSTDKRFKAKGFEPKVYIYDQVKTFKDLWPLILLSSVLMVSGIVIAATAWSDPIQSDEEWLKSEWLKSDEWLF
jgi:hypothetical protein